VLKRALPTIAIFVVAAAAIYLVKLRESEKETLLPGVEYYTIRFDNGVTMKTEVADTPQETSQGLMYREKLAKDTGMLFILGYEGKHNFWMKNVRIPLDIIFVNRNKEIVKIHRNVPPCEKEPCPTYNSEFPAVYAIETNAGWTNYRKIYESMKVQITKADGAPL